MLTRIEHIIFNPLIYESEHKNIRRVLSELPRYGYGTYNRHTYLPNLFFNIFINFYNQTTSPSPIIF